MAELSDELDLEVATPTGKALSVAATSVQVPSVEGEIGVLPNHLPLLAALKPGVLRYRVEGQTYRAAIGAGYVEAGPGKVRILTDAFAKPEKVDEERVRQELEEAEKRLQQLEGPHHGASFEEARERIDWAHARLQARTEATAS